MKEKILNDIKKYKLIKDGEKIIVGVSGGPDSISLLDVLLKIKDEKIINFEIIVCHINHMIRKEADDDEQYVKKYCLRHNIKFYSKKIEVEKFAKKKKIGTEEAGRRARYDFFYEIQKKENADKIATAHNKNDNAETVLMNIMRGSSISGLIGIEPIRNDLIRPLINCRRDEIEEYCKSNNLQPRIDKTNFENNYTRNKIRNLLIPYIEEHFNSNIIDSINRLSDLAKEENEYMQNTIIKYFNELIIKEENKDVIVLDLKKFNNLEKVIKSRLVLYTINILLKTKNGIEKKNIEDILKLCERNIGNKFIIPTKGVKILVKDKKIFFIRM